MALNPTVGTRTSVTVTGLSTLANTAFAVGDAVNHNTNKPVDVVYEVSLATTNAVTGNKQAKVYIQASIDGTNYTSTATPTTTDEPDLIYLGLVNMGTSSITHTAVFSVGQRLGFIPHSSKIIVFNDCGVTLTTGTVYYSEISIP